MRAGSPDVQLASLGAVDAQSPPEPANSGGGGDVPAAEVGPDAEGGDDAGRVVSPEQLSEIDAQLSRLSLESTKSPPPQDAGEPTSSTSDPAATDIFSPLPASPPRPQENEHASPAQSPAAYGVVEAGKWRNSVSPVAIDNTEPLLRETNTDAFVASGATHTETGGSNDDDDDDGGGGASDTTVATMLARSAAGWPGSQVTESSQVKSSAETILLESAQSGASTGSAAEASAAPTEETTTTTRATTPPAAAASSSSSTAAHDATTDAATAAANSGTEPAVAVPTAPRTPVLARSSNVDDHAALTPASAEADASPAKTSVDVVVRMRAKSPSKNKSKGKKKQSFRKSTAL